jgi:hypothetical protein
MMTSKPSFKVAEYANVLEKVGNNTKYKLLSCDKVFWGTGTRVSTHITGMGKGIAACTKVPADLKATAVQFKLANDVSRTSKKRQREDEQELLEEHRANHQPAGPTSADPLRGTVSFHTC